MLVVGDAGGRRPHLGRRQHLQGQRHRAVLPLRPARQPEPADLQAVARPAVHRRARRPQGDVRVPRRRRPRVPDERREGLLDRLQHPRAPRTRPRTSSSSTRASTIVQPIMGVAFWRDDVAVARRDVSRPLRGGPAGRAQRPDLRRPGRAVPRGQRHRRPPRPRHVRPDREPHHRGQEPRHLRGARHGAAATSPTSAWSPASTTRTPSSSTATTAAASAGCSTRAAGSTRRR